jgi:outer membrane protein assembly factor BamB
MKRASAAILFFWAVSLSVFSQGSDSVNWRGTDAYGIVRDASFNPDALKGEAKIIWKAELGRGYSLVEPAGDVLYTMGSKSGKNIVYCLSAKDGSVVWTMEYPCVAGQYPGPKSTPVLDGDNLYTFSQQGDLHCLEAKTGKIKWVVDLKKAASIGIPTWGEACAPLVLGNMILLNAGKNGVAVDKKTGNLIWKSGETAGYANPALFTAGNREMAAMFGENRLYSVDLSNGNVGWSAAWQTSYDVNAADPMIVNNRIFISSNYGRGCALFEFTDREVKKIWENKNISSHFASFSYAYGFLYGVNGSPGNDGSSIVCLELATGASKWKAVKGFGSLVAVNGFIVMLNEDGGIFVSRLASDAYAEVASAKLPKSGLFWTPPFVMNGRLYARSDRGILYCVSAGK